MPIKKKFKSRGVNVSVSPEAYDLIDKDRKGLGVRKSLRAAINIKYNLPEHA